MIAQLECLVCMLKQGMNSARVATNDKTLQEKAFREVSALVEDMDLNMSPAYVSQPVYETVARITGNPDPFKDLKVQTNQEALKLVPQLREIIKKAPDPLYTAFHVSVAGNMIDMGIGHQYEMSEMVQKIIDTPFTIDCYKKFKKDLASAKSILFLSDNSGEIVFDRLLVEQLVPTKINIKYCVKSGPIINDAMMEDAKVAGIPELVEVIETGSNDIGVNFEKSSQAFLDEFNSADIIIAKGHGNFETCCDLPNNIYFILKAKCIVVANQLGVEEGSIVFANYENQVNKKLGTNQ
jgi:damage-control phosphatase, subfamily I